MINDGFTRIDDGFFLIKADTERDTSVSAELSHSCSPFFMAWEGKRYWLFEGKFGSGACLW